MTDLELRLYTALRRITKYDRPDYLRKHSQRDYGLPFEEALEYSYKNVKQEAADAIKGVRLPRKSGRPSRESIRVEQQEMVAARIVTLAPEQPLTRCAAAKDGECSHSQCPQIRDGEPAKSGRHCPIDNWSEDD